MKVSHREYITDILASSGAAPTPFQIQSFPINLGQALTFPWGSVIAQDFLLYRISHLEFEFVSTAAMSYSSSTNIALGKVLMRYEADPTIPVDGSLYQMENSDGVVVHKPAESFDYPVDLDLHRLGQWTVRTGSQPANTDLRMYDQGFLMFATSGLPQSSVNVGQLFVKYIVEFKKPFMIAGLLGNTIRSAEYTSTAHTNAFPLNGNAVVNTDAIGLTLTSSTVTFPVSISIGNYLVSIIWSGSVTAIIAYPTVTFTNCSVVTSYVQGNATSQSGVVMSADAGATLANCALSFLISINAPGATQASFSFGAATLPSGTKSMILTVTQVNPTSL